MDKLLPISSDGESDSSISTVLEPKTKVKIPSLYRVILINDDFTPMEFVVEILQTVFHKDRTAATEIMMNVHNKGRGVCGVYPYEIAETKVAIVLQSAKERGFPLQCTMERA